MKFASAAAFATSVAATTAAAAVSSDATSTTAAAAVELPEDVARMIWQRRWRMEAAALIQRGVRHAIFSQWGMPPLIDDDEVRHAIDFSQWGMPLHALMPYMPLLMDEMTAWEWMTVPVSQPHMRSAIHVHGF